MASTETVPLYIEDEKGHPQFRLGNRVYKIDCRITNMMYIASMTGFGYRNVLYVTDYTALNRSYFTENDDDGRAVVEAFRVYRGLQ
jgi:hypothetical protein